MQWFKSLWEFLSERLLERHAFFYQWEQVAYERRREQIQQSAYLSCRRPRE